MITSNASVRPSVMLDAMVISLIPVAMNVLRLLDPNGSKLPAVLLLLLIVFKNILFLPGVSWQYQKAMYGSKIDANFQISVLLPLTLLLVLSCVAVGRGLGGYYTLTNFFSNLALMMIGLLALVTAFTNARNTEERECLLKSAPAGLVILVLANLAGFAAGFASTPILSEDRLNQTLAIFGVTVGRVSFPLTVGTNAFGSVCALAAISSFAFWAGRGRVRKLVTLFLFVCCFVALIAVDSRAAMAAMFIAGIWLILLRRLPRWKYLPLLLILFSPIMPFLLAALFSAINDQGFLSGLIRSGAQGARLGVGTGRQYIWSSAAEQIANADFIHLIGYGAYGQVQSKFSMTYSWIFNELGQTAASLHNTALQNFFDMGYVGVVVWIACLWSVMSSYIRISASQNFRGPFSIILASLTYLVLQAQTEVVVTIYTPELLFYFMTVAVSVASASKSAALMSSPPPTNQRHSYQSPHGFVL